MWLANHCAMASKKRSTKAKKHSTSNGSAKPGKLSPAAQKAVADVREQAQASRESAVKKLTKWVKSAAADLTGE